MVSKVVSVAWAKMTVTLLEVRLRLFHGVVGSHTCSKEKLFFSPVWKTLVLPFVTLQSNTSVIVSFSRQLLKNPREVSCHLTGSYNVLMCAVETFHFCHFFSILWLCLCDLTLQNTDVIFGWYGKKRTEWLQRLLIMTFIHVLKISAL